MNKTAIVIGATGLVGSEVLKLLLDDPEYAKVKVFHRRSTGIHHPKLEEHIDKFEEIDSWKHLLTGDELYSAMGTTLKKAGSKEAQWKIDYTYQYETAKAAALNGVKKYALVSSIGANVKARSFYTSMKGKLDEAIRDLPFEGIAILRPSVLDGDRKESRPGESLGIFLGKMIAKIPGLKKYRSIPAKTVAKGMLYALKKSPLGYHIFESKQIFEL